MKNQWHATYSSLCCDYGYFKNRSCTRTCAHAHLVSIHSAACLRRPLVARCESAADGGRPAGAENPPALSAARRLAMTSRAMSIFVLHGARQRTRVPTKPFARERGFYSVQDYATRSWTREIAHLSASPHRDTILCCIGRVWIQANQSKKHRVRRVLLRRTRAWQPLGLLSLGPRKRRSEARAASSSWIAPKHHPRSGSIRYVQHTRIRSSRSTAAAIPREPGWPL